MKCVSSRISFYVATPYLVMTLLYAVITPLNIGLNIGLLMIYGLSMPISFITHFTSSTYMWLCLGLGIIVNTVFIFLAASKTVKRKIGQNRNYVTINMALISLYFFIFPIIGLIISIFIPIRKFFNLNEGWGGLWLSPAFLAELEMMSIGAFLGLILAIYISLKLIPRFKEDIKGARS